MNKIKRDIMRDLRARNCAANIKAYCNGYVCGLISTKHGIIAKNDLLKFP